MSPDRKGTLLRLLDDPSVPVRRALLAHFTELGGEAGPFLQEVARGSNRILARHAAWFLDELKFTDPISEFRGFIRSLNYELETGALLLARTVNPALDVGACWATWPVPFDREEEFHFMATAYYLSPAVRVFWEKQLGGPIIWFGTTLEGIADYLEKLPVDQSSAPILPVAIPVPVPAK